MAEAGAEIDEEELLARHRREAKDIRGKIQALKKSAPKGDKKRKKEVAAEVALLEETLQAKHDLELEKLKSQDPIPPESTFHSGNDKIEEDMKTLKVGEENEVETKKSRTQKRKEKKAQQELARKQRMAEEEAESAASSNPRLEEREKLVSVLQPLGLAIRDIEPNGHCLYAALSDQLSVKMGIEVGVVELRRTCADHIREHSPSFLPFLTDTTTGDQLSQAEFDRYCSDIADTATWGGQLEIRALSCVYRVPVEVFQADAPRLVIGERGEEGDTDQLIRLSLSYHLKEYQLGEHYNSVVPADTAS